MGFIQLIRNEIMKVNARRTAPYFYIFMAVVAIGSAIILKFIGPSKGINMDYISFIQMSMMWTSSVIGMFTMVLGAQIFTDEWKEGTIKQLLIRPWNRSSILFSKYIAVIFFLLVSYIFAFAFSSVLGVAFFGTKVTSEYTMLILIKKVLYSIPKDIFYLTLAFSLAAIFKGIGIALSTAIIANSLSMPIMMLSSNHWWTKYIIFGNLNLEVYDANPLISNNAPKFFDGGTLGFSLTITIIHIVALVIISNLIFAKKDVV
ncbi:MAG: ABC transporter permease [Clostridium argentinense]|uniref:ABC transporter permease n=1 Tax=Clostridium faecium TaxID=2762223 RepID=A0ABR8YN44_9CLOT|nr:MULTISPECIES: ABC transporter permease [Clostridium]MBD8045670.1 ABC transporter permease [Clostridium faecium]MBS5823696.1 ABC transporter permease [Clostridium argentinense]MDU1350491.1 ABC transporter permease [Clostridium argentinense]